MEAGFIFCAFFIIEEVFTMKFDLKLITGIFVGMLLGLHYSSVLIPYIPLLMVPTVILVLKHIHR